MVLFARQFLSLRDTARWLDIFLKVMQWILLAGGLTALFMPIGLPYPILNALILLIGPSLVLAGLVRWKQGYKPAVLYSAGWVIFVSSMVMYSLRMTGMLPANTFTNYAIQAASVWEAILFSLALAYRIKVIEEGVATAKNTFLGMVSHELKTPLQRITSSIELLLARPHEERNRQPLLRIQSAAEHLDIQVKDLTDFARLESGKLRLRSVDLDPRQMVVNIADEFRPQAEAKGLELRWQVEEAHALVQSDSLRIQQILNNLVSNAIKYTNRGYVALSLGYFPGRQTLCFVVEDSGIGIDREDQASAFEPFTQIDNARASKYDGMGMGLTIVRSLLALLGGTMQIESTSGKGTRFSVDIPVKFLEFSATSPGPDASRRILLVDDDDEVRAALGDIVQMLSYDCDEASGGRRALELASQRQYGAILLDINMPDIDGLTVADRIRNIPGANRRTPIVWISATVSYDMTPEQKKLFIHCLEKPIRVENLNTMLQYVVLHGAPEQYVIGNAACVHGSSTAQSEGAHSSFSLIPSFCRKVVAGIRRSILRPFTRRAPDAQ
jgi:signal transduction histidine kinase/CheY-like chemotaxis protein